VIRDEYAVSEDGHVALWHMDLEQRFDGARPLNGGAGGSANRLEETEILR